MRSSVVASSGRRPALDGAVDEPLEITLFGTLLARRQGEILPLRLPQQAVRLLAYLLLHRERAQSREHVAFTLWPDDDEADARANLRRKLHLLQRALPVAETPWIVTTPTSVAWNCTAPYRLDVAEFEALCREQTSFADADALYGGDLLVDLYDDWVVRERDRLHALATDNLTTLVARRQQLRDYAGAIRFAQRLRALDPWREDAVRALITLRYEAGDRAGALTEYERFRAAVVAEMGVEPMPETLCVYEGVLAFAQTGRPDSPPAVSAAQPAPGLPFVGRERDLRDILAAWTPASNGTGSAMLVVGEAGIGKTRLIDEFATVASANGGRVLRGGTTPFELAPYQPFSEALRGALPMLRETSIEPLWLAVLATLVPQLHIAVPALQRLTPLEAEPERTRLFEAVAIAIAALEAVRPTVLILEDLHWAGSATIALLEYLVRRAPLHRLLIIASYREEELSRTHPLRALRRRLERERLLNVVALAPLDTAAIERIVGQYCDDDVPHRTAIARYLRDCSDGNPFFLGEVVANDREAGFLDGKARHWRPRDTSIESLQSLSSTLSARLDRLSPPARAVAEIGAVIGRSFSAELVREVNGVDERSTRDSVGELIDRRLVREVDTTGNDFAFSHQLIQQTVYAGLPDQTRLRRHRRVANVIEELYGEHIEQFAAEIASHYDRGGEPERAAEYYCLAGRHGLALYGSEEAATLAVRGRELTSDPVTRFRATEIIEEAARRLGDRSGRRTNIELLLALARAIDDQELLREALRRQILLAHDCAEREAEREAIARLETCLAGARPEWSTTFALLQGSYLIAIGSFREARAILAHALPAAGAHDHPRLYVEWRCALVELAGFEGRIDEVRAFLAEVPVFEQTYDFARVVTLLEAACAAASKVQDSAALASCADRLMECSRAIGYREGEAAAFAFAGRAALRLFEIDRARELLQRAAEMFAAIGQPLKQFYALSDIATLAVTIGDFDTAIERFQAADAIAISISYGFGHVACINNISYAAYLKGDFVLARSAAIRALEAADVMEAPSARAHALVSIGVAQRELGDSEAAIKHLEAGTALERSLDETIALGEDLCELIVALLRCNQLERATVIAGEVLALAQSSTQRLSHPQYMFWTAAAVQRAKGDANAAHELLTRARRTLDELEAAIPDPQSRATFRRLRYNRAIDDAYDHDRWQIS